MKLIEEHYLANRQRLIKNMTFRSGTEWDAEDIVQEAYTRAIKYIEGFDGTNFDRWFKPILFNAFKAHKNSENGHTASEFDEEEVEGIPCNQYTDAIVAEISELIDTKSESQIEVLTLYFFKGYSATDISQISEQNYSAIHKTIFRFSQELTELYK